MIMEAFEEAINEIIPRIDAHKDKPNLEIEIRIGYLESGAFNPDIGKDFFDKIEEQLADSEVWTSCTNEHTIDYVMHGRRLTEMDDKTTKCLKKTKLDTIDLKLEGSGFNVRIAISTETSSPRFAKEKALFIRDKTRTSYYWKHLRFDLTRVITENNTIKHKEYEIEVEAVKFDLSKMSTKYFVHDLLLKMKDIADMCEPLESFKFVVESKKSTRSKINE